MEKLPFLVTFQNKIHKQEGQSISVVEFRVFDDVAIVAANGVPLNALPTPTKSLVARVSFK